MTTFSARWMMVGAGLVALLGSAGVAQPVQAQQGTVAGRVTDRTNGQAVPGARIGLVGSNLFATTGADGQYTIRNVAVGDVTLRITAVGYSAERRNVAVGAGATATADFALALTAFSLDEVVVTATGDQPKREVGHAIARISPAALTESAPIANMNDLLAGRVAGVSVSSGALTGSMARVRIRGNNSLSLNNDPVYILDGVKIESATNSSSIGIGGTNPSRVNDLNPEEIESIEFIKGPAASALYGTAAANGVIVIKTKQGRGRPQWHAYAEAGAVRDLNNYPIAYRGWTAGATPTNNTQCFLTQLAAGSCTQDSVTAFNLFEDPDASPNGTGYRQQYGLQLSSGTEALRYFVSAEWEDEVGQLVMPRFAQDSVKARRQITEVPFDQLRPNAYQRTSLRANLGTSPGRSLDIQVSTGFISSNQRLPQTDNNTTGLLSNAFGGPGNKDNGRFGYRLYTPDQFFSEVTTQSINRFIGSGSANWRPVSWLTGVLTAGVDYTARVDANLCRRGECTPFSQTSISGFKENNRSNFFSYTANANATAEFTLTPTITSRSSMGLQYFKRQFNRNGAFAEDLAPGATTVTAGSIPQADETTDITITLGSYVEQLFGWRERLFLTGALRVDDNSAFGADFSAVFYPKASLSYVISEESFFPVTSLVTDLRVRAAWGVSGVQPGTTDAVQFYSPTTASVENTDRAALVFGALGNLVLKPERSEEFETGLDASLFNDRMGLEFTWYRKVTKDALIERTVAPSVGAAADRFENLGSVRNTGIEALLNAHIIDNPSMGWDLAISGSYNSNTLASLGGVPPIIGTTIHQREGYPLNSYWLQPYTFADADGNGIITASEITVQDSAAFIGPNPPPRELSLTTGLELFGRKLRINAMLDHKQWWQLNGTERIRCESRLNCEGLVDPNAPLWMQARVVALRETPSRTQWGFVEDAGYIRFRELSVSYELPASFANALRMQRITITAAGRNLVRWTDYSGIDPESAYFSGALGTQSDFQTAAPPSYFTFRLNVNW